MNAPNDKPTLEEQASQAFLQPLQGEWSAADQAALEARLSTDPAYAKAYGKADRMWRALGTHAGSPELMRHREEAIAYARQVSGRRWLTVNRERRRRWQVAVAAAGIMFILAGAWLISPFGYLPGDYRTAIGEQRSVELEDQSRIIMDAATRLRVRYSDDARLIELKEGQAQFSVARDPTRPFKVKVGDRTVVALGTIFTVEYVGQRVRVAMMEGRVAVVTDPQSPEPAPSRRARPTRAGQDQMLSQQPGAGVAQVARNLIELTAGEAMLVARDGRVVVDEADIEAATAWQEGKVIFRAEPLGEAVARLNRYSEVRIEVADPTLAAEPISGVFETGNAARFVAALSRSLPVESEADGAGRLRLHWR